jgi:hypothetical protein
MRWSHALRILSTRLFGRSRKAFGRMPRCLPALEALEGRTVPSAKVVVGPPVANPDWTDTDGSNPITVNVLANDSASAVPSTVALSDSPLHGTAVVNHSTGAITYTANATFTGTDTFQYTVRNAMNMTSNVATVSVRVNRPTAADDWIDTDGTTPVTIDVLANDTDPDGNQHIVPGSVTIVSGPLHGRITGVDPITGRVTYVPNTGWGGTDTFRYTIHDDAGATFAPATVTVLTLIPIASPATGVTSGPKAVGFAVMDTAGSISLPDPTSPSKRG